MWLCITLALALTPNELGVAAEEAADQLGVCASEGCAPAEGARAAFVAAVHQYQDEGVADGVLAATVRRLAPELFAELPDVLQRAATEPAAWAAPPPVPSPEELPRGWAEDVELACVGDPSSARPARVLVTRWPGADAVHDHPRVVRNVQAVLDHPQVTVLSGIDLYQGGRADRLEMPALVEGVSEETLDQIALAAAETAGLAADTLSEAEWATRAQELVVLEEAVWFVDRAELRGPLFALYAQIGRAASLGGLQDAPFRQAMGKLDEVNTYAYRAAALAHAEPELLATLDDPSLQASIGALRDQLEAVEPVQISLALADEPFDAAGFASEYTVTVDGLEVLVSNRDGLLTVPPGRTDLSLTRADGYGLSERFALSRGGSRIYFVRMAAQQAASVELTEQILQDTQECSPSLPSELRGHLAVYQALHADEDLYVAVPEDGRAARGKLRLWRWNPTAGRLQFVK